MSAFRPGVTLPQLVAEINRRNENEPSGTRLVFCGHHQRINNLLASSGSADIALTRVHEKIAVGTSEN